MRRQTAPRPGEKELQVLDYQNTQWTLMRTLAAAYALHFMGADMMAAYHRFEADRERGDFRALPEVRQRGAEVLRSAQPPIMCAAVVPCSPRIRLHAGASQMPLCSLSTQLHPLSSGLKAVASWMAAEGIEECRRCCGGQGYSVLSGLPTLLASYVQNCTWEGDNNVMALQMARFLVKQMHRAEAGKAPGGQCAYFASKWTGQLPLDTPSDLLRALQAASAASSRSAVARLRDGAGAEPTVEGPRWNGNTVSLIDAAKAHCRVVLAETFLRAVEGQRGTLADTNVHVLGRLAHLFVSDMVRESLAVLLASALVTGPAAAALVEREVSGEECHLGMHSGSLCVAGSRKRADLAPCAMQEALVREVRADAVPLVDSFAHEDYLLNSAIGRCVVRVPGGGRGWMEAAQDVLLTRVRER